MRVRLALAFLGLLLPALPAAQACSLTGTPTGCATSFYRVEKGNAEARLAVAQAWSRAAGGGLAACSDAPGLAAPRGPGTGMLTEYAADMPGGAGALLAGLPGRTGPALAVFLLDGYDRTARLALGAENAWESLVLDALAGAVDAAWRDPGAALAGGAGGVQAYALASQGAAGAVLLCAQRVPTPAL